MAMIVTQHKRAKITYPTGNPNFSVYQAFPAGVREQDADPFLMCDHFGPTMEEKGVASDPDEFPVGWHPHRGFSIATYLIAGVGRHADSLGNRGTFESPGLQWMNVGSGVMHAEGGGNPKGTYMEGFQIWVNLPSALKMEPPTYGTVEPENLPSLYLQTNQEKELRMVLGSARDRETSVCTARFVAGPFSSSSTYFQDNSLPAPRSFPSSAPFSGSGPFETVQPVQIVDVDICTRTPFSSSSSTSEQEKDEARKSAAISYCHSIPAEYDSALVYVYRGAGKVNGKEVKQYDVLSLDAKQGSQRQIRIDGGSSDGVAVMIFAGKRLDQPIAWRGPMVMTTPAEIQTAYLEFQQGTFLKKKASWDFTRIADRPA